MGNGQHTPIGLIIAGLVVVGLVVSVITSIALDVELLSMVF